MTLVFTNLKDLGRHFETVAATAVTKEVFRQRQEALGNQRAFRAKKAEEKYVEALLLGQDAKAALWLRTAEYWKGR